MYPPQFLDRYRTRISQFQFPPAGGAYLLQSDAALRSPVAEQPAGLRLRHCDQVTRLIFAEQQGMGRCVTAGVDTQADLDRARTLLLSRTGS